MRIVLIDDSATNLGILRNLCHRIAGAECVSFTDSETALSHLSANDAEMVIVDYSMPKITGIELVKRLRATARHAATPIMMVTGSTEAAVHRRAIEVGATDFLTKPIRPSEYLHRLAELLAVPRSGILKVAS